MDRPWVRGISLLAALAISAVLMLYPYAVGTQMTARTHIALPFLLFGVSGGFVHGLGFKPDSRVLRAVFSPLVAWPLIVVGIGLIARG